MWRLEVSSFVVCDICEMYLLSLYRVWFQLRLNSLGNGASSAFAQNSENMSCLWNLEDFRIHVTNHDKDFYFICVSVRRFYAKSLRSTKDNMKMSSY